MFGREDTSKPSAAKPPTPSAAPATNSSSPSRNKRRTTTSPRSTSPSACSTTTSTPHHLLPAAGARVLPDRAHRNRNQGSHGRLHRRHGQDPGRSQHQPRDRHRSVVHPARAPAGRCESCEGFGFRVKIGSA